jgi:hypothetical protein
MQAQSDEPPSDVPLSHVIRIAEIGGAGETMDVTATPAQCAAIARQLKIPHLSALHGRFVLEAEQQNRFLATLHLKARVTQICVVSLETFEANINEDVKLIFVPADDISAFDDDPESPDEIPFDGTVIDLGAALTEQLALSLDPYPRKPDVTLPEEAQAAPENPFALFFKESRRASDEFDD